MIPEQHFDVAGKPITIGCLVATNIQGYVYELVVCKVVDLTPQKVRLEFFNDRHFRPGKIQTTLRFPKQLAVVGKEEQ